VVQKYKKHVTQEALRKLKKLEARRRAKESDRLWSQRRRLERFINRAFRAITVRAGGLASLERYKRLTLLAALRYLEKLTGRSYLSKSERNELKQLRREASAAWKAEERKQRRRVERYRKAVVRAQRRLDNIKRRNQQVAQEEFGKKQQAKEDQRSAWRVYIGHLRTLRDAPMLQANATAAVTNSSSSGSGTTVNTTPKVASNGSLVKISSQVKSAFDNLAVSENDEHVMKKYQERLTQHASKVADAL